MVTIYKDKRDNKLYALDEMITQGVKVCLVPFDKNDDKFVSPSTLKRWYTKWEEAQVLVEIKAFTGMKIGLFKVASYDEHKCRVFTKGDKLLEFDMASEKQINAKNPKFANKLGQVYGMFIPYWLNNKDDRKDLFDTLEEALQEVDDEGTYWGQRSVNGEEVLAYRSPTGQVLLSSEPVYYPSYTEIEL